MSTIDNGLNALDPQLKRNWGWLLGLGILFVILGCIGLGMVVSLTLASMVMIGALVVIAGVFQVADTFKSKEWKVAVWHLIIAVLYLIAGVVILHDPFLASTIITAMLAWIFILIGILRCYMALSLKNTAGWGWMLLAGVAALVLGVLILMQWPMSGLWFIGMLIAIELIINGWSYIFIAMAVHRTASK